MGFFLYLLLTIFFSVFFYKVGCCPGFFFSFFSLAKSPHLLRSSISLSLSVKICNVLFLSFLAQLSISFYIPQSFWQDHHKTKQQNLSGISTGRNVVKWVNLERIPKLLFCCCPFLFSMWSTKLSFYFFCHGREEEGLDIFLQSRGISV